MHVTFALCSVDTLSEPKTLKDGRIIYPKSTLYFVQDRTILGCNVLASDRDSAKQFPTRVTAERYRRDRAGSNWRVIKIGVGTLKE